MHGIDSGDDTIGFLDSLGLRPCFSLKSDAKILGGKGTRDEPYYFDKENKSDLEKLKEGDYIKYDTGVTSVGENGIVTCRVLYDINSKYGVQIISDKNVANVKLGKSDTWAEGRDAYNNAISTLNTEAEKYLNIKYATDARCVGSLPTLQNGTFINKNSEDIGPVNLNFTSSAEGVNNMKGTDANSVSDKRKLKSLNIEKTGNNYWLASRYAESSSNHCYFYVNIVKQTAGSSNGYESCYVYSSGTTFGRSQTQGLRPCFSLKHDVKITGGNGTSKDPYTM